MIFFFSNLKIDPFTGHFNLTKGLIRAYYSEDKTINQVRLCSEESLPEELKH